MQSANTIIKQRTVICGVLSEYTRLVS